MSRTDERLSITLPVELKEQFAQIAALHRRSLIAEATIAIENYVHDNTTTDEHIIELINNVLDKRGLNSVPGISVAAGSAEYRDNSTITQNGNGNNAIIRRK